MKKKEISCLSLINLKENVELEYPYSFEIACPSRPKPLIFLTDSQKNHVEWCSTIRNNIELMLSKSNEISNVAIHLEEKIPSMYDLKETKEKLISKIFKNNYCADCNNNEACWVSLNLCVILCLECSGIHRKLGPNISKIRSLKLDNLNYETIEIFHEIGTASVNQIWEANAMNFMHLKPFADSKTEVKVKWIKKKCVDHEFVNKKIGDFL